MGHGWNLCILFQKQGDYQSMIQPPLSSRVSFSHQRLGCCDAVEIEGAHRRDALTQPLEGVLGGKN
jgi:hypothetical protein